MILSCSLLTVGGHAVSWELVTAMNNKGDGPLVRKLRMPCNSSLWPKFKVVQPQNVSGSEFMNLAQNLEQAIKQLSGNTCPEVPTSTQDAELFKSYCLFSRVFPCPTKKEREERISFNKWQACLLLDCTATLAHTCNNQ